MGITLDSSILIAAERSGLNAHQALAEIARQVPGDPIGISVITALELEHGVVRAQTAERRDTRSRFLKEIMAGLPVYPVTPAVALRAGRLDAEAMVQGTRVPLADLLIAVTALELGYQVATRNLRHFSLTPDLQVAVL